MKKIYNRSVYTKNDAGNAFFIALIAPSILFLIVFNTVIFVASSAKLGNIFAQDSMGYKIIGMLCAQFGLLATYFVYNKANRFNFKKASKLSFKLNLKNVLVSILIALVALFGFLNLINLADQFFSKFLNHQPQPLPFSLDSVGMLAFNLFFLAVLPAISEELVFRGIIYNGLRQYGKKTAIIVSALLFAAIHGNIDQTVYPILFGLVLAYIVYRTGNITYAMIAHFTSNTTVIVFNYLVNLNPTPPVQESTSLLNFGGVVTAFLLAIAAFAIIWLLAKLLKKQKTDAQPYIMDDLESLQPEQLEMLESSAPVPHTQAPQGVNKKTWETIICQKNDLFALEKAKYSMNILLWMGVVLSGILWLMSF